MRSSTPSSPCETVRAMSVSSRVAFSEGKNSGVAVGARIKGAATGEAAELLHVLRPFVAGLIDKGLLDGLHRRRRLAPTDTSRELSY